MIESFFLEVLGVLLKDGPMFMLHPFKRVPECFELLGVTNCDSLKSLDLRSKLINNSPCNDLFLRDPGPGLFIGSFLKLQFEME